MFAFPSLDLNLIQHYNAPVHKATTHYNKVSEGWSRRVSCTEHWPQPLWTPLLFLFLHDQLIWVNEHCHVPKSSGNPWRMEDTVTVFRESICSGMWPHGWSGVHKHLDASDGISHREYDIISSQRVWPLYYSRGWLWHHWVSSIAKLLNLRTTGWWVSVCHLGANSTCCFMPF